MTSEHYVTLASADDRDAWLKARLNGIGASDTPIIMGLVNWSSPIELWGIKTGRLPEDAVEENERMLWGQRLEPLVAEEYERQTGRPIERWAEVVQSVERPFMLATCDYSWPMPGRSIAGRRPVEIKTTDASRKADWDEGAPPHVYHQVQHQLAVTGASMASVGVLVGGNTFRWCDVERDEDAIAEIVAACEQFWQYVKDDVPPPADGSEATSRAIGELWPITAEGESIVLPDDAYDWVAELEEAKEQEKTAKARVRELEQAVKIAMGNAEVGVLPNGDPGFTYRTQTRKAHEVKESTFRVLRRVTK